MDLQGPVSQPVIMLECKSPLLGILKFIILIYDNTALFGKVYRTIFQSKRRRLVFKTGVIMILINMCTKICVSILYLHIIIFVIKLKHNMIFLYSTFG